MSTNSESNVPRNRRGSFSESSPITVPKNVGKLREKMSSSDADGPDGVIAPASKRPRSIGSGGFEEDGNQHRSKSARSNREGNGANGIESPEKDSRVHIYKNNVGHFIRSVASDCGCGSPGRVIKFTNVKVLRDHALQNVDLWVENGRIIDPMKRFWSSKNDTEFLPDFIIDGGGAIAAPGFIEVQLNGAFGIDFSDSSMTTESLKEVGRKLLAQGVTSFCPTLVTSSQEKYRQILPHLKRYPGSAENGAANLGAHVEGPFMNKFKKGAHDEAQIADPVDGLKSVVERYGSLDNITMITLAPELPGALDAIDGLVSRGVVVSLGHSKSDIATAREACRKGARMVTHMFNAMSAFHHRDPGIVGLLGEVSLARQPFFGLIADGIHTHPSAIKIAYLAHPAGVVLVTDAMQAMGLPDGRHKLGDMEVDVVGYKATIAGTETLAGSAVGMDQCVRGFIEFTGCSLVEAVEAASLHPAQLLGIQDSKGHLGFGADADVVLIDPETHEILSTYIGGEKAC